MQYKSKNGCTYDITQADGSHMAHYDGQYIAQAEKQEELEKILDHRKPDNTYRYLKWSEER